MSLSILHHTPSSISSSGSSDSFTRRVRFAPLPVPERLPDSLPSLPASLPSSPKEPKPAPPPPSRSKSWLRSFLRQKSHPPSSAHSSPRSSDPEESKSTDGDGLLGIPLGRWTSASSLTSTRSLDEYTEGAPLTRSQSANRSKGTRMLNGRVYGARRNTPSNPFNNIGDESDTEFVEWGYGGMGSSRAGGGGMWTRVQSDRSVISSGGDEDDGSGMAWVRRKREQRERERAEREAKGRSPDKDIQADKVPSSSPPPVADTLPPARTDSSALSNQEHHILRAVTVPAPKHVGHSRGHSASAISAIVGGSRTPSRPGSEPSSRVASTTDLRSKGNVVDVDVDVDEDEDEEDESGIEGGDDDDDDAVDEEETRKTALGAGVEKVSRHQDKT